MFKVYSGKVYNVQKDDMQFNDLIDFFRAGDGMALLTRLIVMNNDKIEGAVSVEDILAKRKASGVTLLHNENVFEDARIALNKIDNPENKAIKFPVLDSEGRVLYILEYLNNGAYDKGNYYFGKQKSSMSNYHNYDTNSEIIDLHFLEKSDIYIFDEYNEYSDALVKVIRRYYPKKKCFFLDSQAAFFLGDNMVQSKEYISLYMHNNPTTNALYINGDIKNISIDGMFANTFGLLDLFDAVFWPQINLSKKIGIEQRLVLRGGSKKAPTGLIAQLDRYTKLQEFSKLNNIKLIVQSDSYSMNSFRSLKKYFNLPNIEYDYEDKNDYDGYGGYIPYLYKMTLKTILKEDSIFTSYAKEILKNTVKEYLPENARVLGVLARGTDYVYLKPTNHAKVTETDRLLDRVMRTVELDGYDYVYLATEDEDIYNRFFNIFGEFLISVDQKRYSLSQFNDSKRAIADIITDETEEQKEERMLDYIKVLYVLSKCTSLIASNDCGGVRFAKEINDNKYEECYVYENGRYE